MIRSCRHYSPPHGAVRVLWYPIYIDVSLAPAGGAYRVNSEIGTLNCSLGREMFSSAAKRSLRIGCSQYFVTPEYLEQHPSSMLGHSNSSASRLVCRPSFPVLEQKMIKERQIVPRCTSEDSEILQKYEMLEIGMKQYLTCKSADNSHRP